LIKSTQDRFKPGSIESTYHATIMGHSDLTSLFRYHHSYGIAHLADSKGGSVAQTKMAFAAVNLGSRKWHYARGCQNTVATHDYSPIMQLSHGKKDGLEQLTG
jgi:hypothetical protein